MTTPKNRAELIRLLSKTNGYVNYPPGNAEEILTCLEAAGCTVVPAPFTDEMLKASQCECGNVVSYMGFRRIDADAMLAASPYRKGGE